jgi:hypothetical protein
MATLQPKRDPQIAEPVVEPLPPWIANTDRALEDLLKLASNWNSYGAQPIKPEVVRAASDLLREIVQQQTPQPTVVPTVRGGVQLEWHTSAVDLEVEIIPPLQVHVFYRGSLERSEWELESEPDFARLIEIVARLSL